MRLNIREISFLIEILEARIYVKNLIKVQSKNYSEDSTHERILEKMIMARDEKANENNIKIGVKITCANY